MPDHRARQAHQPLGDAADVHEVRGQEEERHREQDERVVGLEGLVHEEHRREPRLEDHDRQAGEPERERDRHARHKEREKCAEQPQRGHSRRQGGAHAAAPFPVSTRQLSTKDSPRKITQVTPAIGQARKIQGIGSSASSESCSQPKRTNSMPHQMNTSANASTNRSETMRSSAAAFGPRSGQTSTSKWLCSRTPIIAPSITIQMKRKRESSSVQIQDGMSPVYLETICSVTGTIKIATVPTISHVSSRWYSSISRLTWPLTLWR